MEPQPTILKDRFAIAIDTQVSNELDDFAIMTHNNTQVDQL